MSGGGANSLTASILIEAPKAYPHIRLWRQNTGGGVGMSVVRRAVALIKSGQIAEGLALLQRPIKFGIEGGGDISGIAGPIGGTSHPKWLPGRRIEIEVKFGKDKMSDQQLAFRHMILAMGGIFIEARSVEQCLADLGVALG